MLKLKFSSEHEQSSFDSSGMHPSVRPSVRPFIHGHIRSFPIHTSVLRRTFAMPNIDSEDNIDTGSSISDSSSCENRRVCLNFHVKSSDALQIQIISTWVTFERRRDHFRECILTFRSGPLPSGYIQCPEANINM